jgi:hypothetical protein
MTMQWSAPVIETIFSIVPGETSVETVGPVMVTYEDLRPGRVGRRAPMTLVKRPSVERLRTLFDYVPETGF